jgi:hypothetical protein
LCQARLLALLSHLSLRVVGTVGREVWGEELDDDVFLFGESCALN